MLVLTERITANMLWHRYSQCNFETLLKEIFIPKYLLADTENLVTKIQSNLSVLNQYFCNLKIVTISKICKFPQTSNITNKFYQFVSSFYIVIINDILKNWPVKNSDVPYSRLTVTLKLRGPTHIELSVYQQSL